MLSGTNLTGGETFYQEWAGSIPTSGTNYLFVSNQDIDYAVAKGMTCFRLLFSWEAIQPSPLTVIGIAAPSAAAANYYMTFKARVDYITKTKGCTCIVDIHGGDATNTGAAYYGVKIGGTYKNVPVDAAFVDLWSRVAAVFKDNPKVWFGLMNEPNGLPALTWFAAAQKAINAIRATGATNVIAPPGVNYTGTATWVSGGSAAAWSLVDPLNKLVPQGHMYFDAGGGGGGMDIVSPTIGVERLKPMMEWARSKGLQVFIAELGLHAATAGSATAWKNTIDYINANADVIVGWCWWAFGPPVWWASEETTLSPSSDYKTDSAQMKLIQSSFAAPVVVPPPVTDPQIAVLQAQVATLSAQVTALTAQLSASRSALMSETAAADAYAGKLDAIRALLT